jgi:hypothetical protein
MSYPAGEVPVSRELAREVMVAAVLGEFVAAGVYGLHPVE